MIFIIPCHNTDKTNYITPCIQSILDTQKNIDNILVVDSASPNKDYIDKVKKLSSRVGVYKAENKNYDYGGYWHGYNFMRMPEVNAIHCFIHDSTILRRDITEDTKINNQLFTPFYWFQDRRNPDKEQEFNWLLGLLEDRGLTLPPDELGVFGPLFTAQPAFLKALRGLRLNEVKPEGKWQAVYAGELLWGYAAYNLGIDIKRCAYHGQLSDPKGEDKVIWKYSGINEVGRT